MGSWKLLASPLLRCVPSPLNAKVLMPIPPSQTPHQNEDHQAGGWWSITSTGDGCGLELRLQIVVLFIKTKIFNFTTLFAITTRTLNYKMTCNTIQNNETFPSCIGRRSSSSGEMMRSTSLPLSALLAEFSPAGAVVPRPQDKNTGRQETGAFVISIIDAALDLLNDDEEDLTSSCWARCTLPAWWHHCRCVSRLYIIYSENNKSLRTASRVDSVLLVGPYSVGQPLHLFYLENIFRRVPAHFAILRIFALKRLKLL